MTTILLCHDGSEGAEQAADAAARLFPDASIVVLTVWEPFIQTISRTGFGMSYGLPSIDGPQIDAASERAAVATAQEAADRLRPLGAGVTGRAQPCGSSVVATILEVADEIHADAIVAGSRGRGGLKSMLLGSVSHALVQHADRPVLVIPAEAVAEQRRAHRTEPAAVES